MNFLKKPDNTSTMIQLDTWLFGDDEKKLQVRSAPSSRPMSPSNPSGTNPPPSLKINPKFVAASAAAANKLQDTYNMAKKNMNKSFSTPYPVPLSKRFRKLLRAKERTDSSHHTDKLALSPTSYTRLRSYAPASLPEIVKDHKKLPYLLTFLAQTPSTEGKTNYHQVLLFLIELEQQKGASRDVQRVQLPKLFAKYFSCKSEFCISGTLDLTAELESLVLDSIGNDDVGWLGFRPIQKLAYKRLAREEMPRFLKSDQYLQMMMEIEQNVAYVPMDRFLTHPRAAHYFLLFLMQQRQHFELYVWLHVEYVIKPSVDDGFWVLVSDLEQKAAVDSAAIQDATKKDLRAAIAARNLADTLAALKLVQQDIFLLLSASWYDRFVKSHLYTLALNDRATKRMLDSDSDTEEKPSFSEYDTETAMIPTSILVHHEESDEDEDSDDDDEGDERKPSKLDLESIIRSTNLPTGLQVHYRPNYHIPTHKLSDLDQLNGVESVVLFKTSLDRPASGPRIEVSYVRRDKTQHTTPENQKKIQELAKRIQPFLVPHGELLSASPGRTAIFPFLVVQNGAAGGNLYGVSYVTSCTMDDSLDFGVCGMCLLSTFPLLDSLRTLLSQHLRRYPDNPMAPDTARLLYQEKEIGSLVIRGGGGEVQQNCTVLLPGLALPPLARLDFNLDVLFDSLSSAVLLEVLANALVEHSVIFLSSSYTALMTCAEALRALLSPLSWCHIYIPLLPKALLSYLHCPTPIMVGVHQTTTTRDDLPIPSDASCVVVVDIDRGTLEYLGARRLVWPGMGLQDAAHPCKIVLPDAFQVAKGKLDVLRRNHISCTDDLDVDVVTCDQSRREVCHELVSSMLCHYNDASLVVGDAHESVIMFDEKKFTSRRPTHEVPFLESLARTQSFSEVISTHQRTLSDPQI